MYHADIEPVSTPLSMFFAVTMFDRPCNNFMRLRRRDRACQRGSIMQALKCRFCVELDCGEML